jgi:hypothetical protein
VLQAMLRVLAHWFVPVVDSSDREAEESPTLFKASYRGYELDFTPDYHQPMNDEPWLATVTIRGQRGGGWVFTKRHGALYSAAEGAAEAGYRLGRLCVHEWLATEHAGQSTPQVNRAN